MVIKFDVYLSPFKVLCTIGAALLLSSLSAARDQDSSAHTLSPDDFTKAGMVYIDGQLIQPLVDTSYLSVRTEYYAGVVETMASAAYASDLFNTCNYYDQCRTTPGVSNESYVNFPDVGIAVNESIVATKLVQGEGFCTTLRNVYFAFDYNSHIQRYSFSALIIKLALRHIYVLISWLDLNLCIDRLLLLQINSRTPMTCTPMILPFFSI